MGGWDKALEYSGVSAWRSNALALVGVVGVSLMLANCTEEAAKQTAAPSAEADAAIVSEIVGFATVTDGDTIRIGPRRIRFDGIDAPEQGRMCGEINIYLAAGDALREVTRAHEVRCRISDQPDAYGRDIAQCRAGDTDLNEYMVAHGWARDWPRYSNGAYADEEAAARAAQLGVWSASCPADLWGDRDYSN